MIAAPQLLTVRGLRVEYPGEGGAVRAVRGIDLDVAAGERVGLVGESGSGKSTAAFAIAGLLRPPGQITAGSIKFENSDLARLKEDDLNRGRGSRLGMVYQDPFTFLNPVMRVGDQIAEVLMAHRGMGRREARARVEHTLEQMGLVPGHLMARKYPHQLSGGQRQRVIIAMATAIGPRLLIADEPTTALDTTVQMQILRLLLEAVAELGSSLLLISHDLAIVRATCQRVYVMYAGRIVESGDCELVFSSPRHPYTRALVDASRRVPDSRGQFPTIAGAPPDLRHPPSGCPFAARCPRRFDRCGREAPLLQAEANWRAACWLVEGRG